VRDGDSIGAYRVLRKIGEGGMGAVFLGEHTLIGRHAAIKVLLPELSSRRESVDRFFNEARAITTISDPGIVQVFDFGFTADNVAYIVMEFLEGEQLDVRLQRVGALTPRDALQITRQAATSLGAAHAAGIVHRDLKPENLYMIRDPGAPGGERLKILDFGIAKLGDDAPDRIRTRTGAVLGTPVYMSPEQCDGASTVDYRADIYSLGCVVFHLIAGRPPFDLPGIGAIISAHLREPPPLLSSLVPGLPLGIDELVHRCLEKAPEDRFATMLELQQACDAVLAHITGAGALPLPLPSASRSMPIAVSRTPPDDRPRTTTLGPASGTSPGEPPAGEPPAGPPPRRLGRWIALAALAGGTGATLAVLSSRPAGRGVSKEPLTSVVVAVPDARPIADARDAPDAPEAPDARDAADAAAATPAIEKPAPHAQPPHPPPTPKPAGRSTAKPAPAKPKPEDLYDDRN
jgi:eukaryotic-like serine/threonine-protein kinase